MLRFIISRSTYDAVSDAHGQTFETLDADLPELERIMSSGDYGESGHDVPHLIGVELLRAAPAPPADPMCVFCGTYPNKSSPGACQSEEQAAKCAWRPTRSSAAKTRAA